MDEEICDYYVPIGKNDKMCKYFIGDKTNQRQISKCRYNCSILEDKKIMEDSHTYKKIHGATRQVR